MNIPIHPVSVNAMYRAYRGRFILSEEGRQFKKNMSNYLCEVKDIKLTTEPVKVSIIFSFSDKRRRDVDNYAKAILDCLTGVLYKDDSQIIELHLYKKLNAETEGILFECFTVAAASEC